MSLVAQIERGPMSRFQVTAIMTCMIINMLDGFDVLVIAFTAPSIAAEWGLSSTEVGLLLSAGLLGMVVGSLLLGPLSDKLGRRPMIMGCLVIITAGMLLSGFTQNYRELAAMRLLTGLGIGGILPGLNTIVSEYSSIRWRSFWVSLLQTGYPIGATLGGILTAVLIAAYGWRSAYFLGAACSLVMIPVVWRHLPESLDFLLERRPTGALERINTMLQKLGQASIDALPPRDAPTLSRSIGYANLLESRALLVRTVLLCLAFFVMMLTFYFVMSWTPKILVDSGMSTTQGISGGIILNVGGIVGSIILGYLSSRLPLARLIMLYVLLSGVLMIVFAYAGNSVEVMVLLALCLGFFLFGSMVGLYALSPQLYPVQSRAAGISIAIGFGRIGGVLSPALAGWLFDAGWAKNEGFVLFALPLIVTIIAVALTSRNSLPQPAR